MLTVSGLRVRQVDITTGSRRAVTCTGRELELHHDVRHLDDVGPHSVHEHVHALLQRHLVAKSAHTDKRQTPTVLILQSIVLSLTSDPFIRLWSKDARTSEKRTCWTTAVICCNYCLNGRSYHYQHYRTNCILIHIHVYKYSWSTTMLVNELNFRSL